MTQRARLVAVLFVLATVACGGAQVSSPGAEEAPDRDASQAPDEVVAVADAPVPGPTSETPELQAPSSGPAAHGEVCSSRDHAMERPCAEGLSCCYPCGIAGCDSVCHTQVECQMDRMRP